MHKIALPRLAQVLCVAFSISFASIAPGNAAALTPKDAAEMSTEELLRLHGMSAPNPNAHFELGYRFATGDRAPLNYQKAQWYYELAATDGNAWAALNLGILHLNGYANPNDPEGTRKWLVEAVRLGNPGNPSASEILSRFDQSNSQPSPNTRQQQNQVTGCTKTYGCNRGGGEPGRNVDPQTPSKTNCYLGGGALSRGKCSVANAGFTTVINRSDSAVTAQVKRNWSFGTASGTETRTITNVAPGEERFVGCSADDTHPYTTHNHYQLTSCQ